MRPATIGEGSPLSWFQERMWLHHQRSPENTSYNLPLLLLIRGNPDVSALERSLSEIVTRHESLRTIYCRSDAGEPLQFVTPPERVRLPVIAVDRTLMLEHLERHLEHRFDLSQGPVFIVSLLRLDADRHLLLFNVHHIAADAWSLKAIFLAELQSAYAAFVSAQQPELPPLSVQYPDYARRQRSQELTASFEDYWQQALAGYEDSLQLPTQHTRKARSGTRSGTFVRRYPSEFALMLERFSRQHGCTIFMTLLAALGVTLSRYTHRDDLCIGTTTSNRTETDLEPLIGFFINILPLRLHIDEHCSVGTLLKTVRAQVLGAFEHPVPFEQILQVTDAANRDSANPLVPIVMRHQNFPETLLGDALPGDVEFRAFPDADETDAALQKLLAREHVPARCEIELSYSGNGDELAVEVVYAADLFERGAIERLLAHHQHALEAMFADPDRRLLELPLLPERDLQKLLHEYNRAPVMPEPEASFVQRFEVQVERAPDAVACWDEHGAWSYLELARRVNQVAQALAARNMGPGELVGVCMERGGELLATLLGVWKVGAAYVPLDPAYPPEYLRQICDDADPGAVLCSAEHQPLLGIDDSLCIKLEHIAAQEIEYLDLDPRRLQPDALAYVMYTSGSTGKPKGVRVPHRQLGNWLHHLESMLPFTGGEVIAQKTTFVFAVAVKELFAGLLNGCPQVFVDNNTVRDPKTFVATMAEYGVSRVNLGPSHLAAVIEYLRVSGQRLPALKICITAGEPLPKDLVMAFREFFPGARLINNYGCTELNDVTYYDTVNFDGSADFVPIGRPIANTRVYVLDRQGRPVPEGVPGELHVATAGMPERYQGLEILTAERFRSNPFDTEPSDRLFNTGDVVRFLVDGTLDYIGRWDFQVKVRGFRVDVRQVEKVLGDAPGIRARAVVGRGERLVAFYTGAPGTLVQMAELREFLQTRLPAYMVPDVFVQREAMPQLPNGKLNRRALLESAGDLQQSGAYEPPVTPTERTLAGIWALVVNAPLERIGRHSHFFEIGGHSLAAMRVLARVKDAFGVELGVSELFDAPRLDTVSAAIDRRTASRIAAEGAVHSPAALRRAPKPSSGTGLLHDKVVLVTGGSRGIGLAVSLLLAEHGASVAINYRDSEAQARRAREQIEAEGGTAEVFGADVTNPAEVASLVQAVHQRFGRIDVLVANAHINFRHRPFVEYDWADLERKVGDELKAVFYPCQAVAREMLKRKSGSIVAVSSSLSKRSNPGFLAQSTAKAAVDAFVRALAAELGPGGVRVNTVAPGLTLTDAAMPMSSANKEAIASRCPMRRNGLPDDMAGAVLFLASDLSRFMTGTYLPVDGGFTML